MPTVDARKLHALAVTLGMMADDAVADAEAAAEATDAIGHYARAIGLRDAQGLLAEITAREMV